MRFNIVIVLLITTLCFMSCGEDECDPTLRLPTIFSQVVLDDNILTIENYLAENGLTAQKTSSNLYYIINEPGLMNEQGIIDKPDICDFVNVTYKGYLPDGTVFDPGGPAGFNLNGVVMGWQEGIPLFGTGGSGQLFIPSYLGYGSEGRGLLIPGNSVLIFDIELNSF